MQRLLNRPKNSIYLGLLLGLLLLVSLVFPIGQMLLLFFSVELWLENADCGYCLLTNLKIVYFILLILWTLFCFYKVAMIKIYNPLLLSFFMLVGYVLTNTVLALAFEKEAMRSSSAFKYLFLWHIGPFSCLTPMIYGFVFYLISPEKKSDK